MRWPVVIARSVKRVKRLRSKRLTKLPLVGHCVTSRVTKRLSWYVEKLNIVNAELFHKTTEEILRIPEGCDPGSLGAVLVDLSAFARVLIGEVLVLVVTDLSFMMILLRLIWLRAGCRAPVVSSQTGALSYLVVQCVSRHCFAFGKHGLFCEDRRLGGECFDIETKRPENIRAEFVAIMFQQRFGIFRFDGIEIRNVTLQRLELGITPRAVGIAASHIVTDRSTKRIFAFLAERDLAIFVVHDTENPVAASARTVVRFHIVEVIRRIEFLKHGLDELRNIRPLEIVSAGDREVICISGVDQMIAAKIAQ